jgi:hypothetical protein
MVYLEGADTHRNDKILLKKHAETRQNIGAFVARQAGQGKQQR